MKDLGVCKFSEAVLDTLQDVAYTHGEREKDREREREKRERERERERAVLDTLKEAADQHLDAAPSFDCLVSHMSHTHTHIHTHTQRGRARHAQGGGGPVLRCWTGIRLSCLQ
jgi:hypothetical protein